MLTDINSQNHWPPSAYCIRKLDNRANQCELQAALQSMGECLIFRQEKCAQIGIRAQLQVQKFW